MPDPVWCDYEAEWFDAAQFKSTSEHGQVHRAVDPGVPLHTTAGDAIIEDDEGTGMDEAVDAPRWDRPAWQ